MSSVKAPRLSVFACPSCGGSLEETASSAFVDCPSCGSPLAILTPDAMPRRAVLPRAGAGAALSAARKTWEGPPIPLAFRTSARIEEPRLLFLPFYEVERTMVGMGSGPSAVIESVERSPAVELPELHLARMDPVALTDETLQIPFRPGSLQKQGTVFDPSRLVSEALPIRAGMKLLEERVSVIYAPLWLIRCAYGRNHYEATVDATSGRLLGARAPAERDARLPQAIGAVYILALASAFIPLAGWRTLLLLLRMREVGIGAGLFLLGGLAWLLSWSWDRIRFRYEVVVEGDNRALRAINRPPQTLPEKISGSLLETAGSLITRVARRGRW